jgi:hypothetical protein
MKFLIRNMVKNNSTFGEAVRFAFIGHHFHVITKQTLRVERINVELENAYQYLRQQITRQSANLVTNSREAVSNLKVIWHKKSRIFATITRKAKYMNEDFREEIIKQANDFEKKLEELIHGFGLDINSPVFS